MQREAGVGSPDDRAVGVFLGMVTASAGKPSLGRAFGWGILLGLVIEGLQAFLASGVSQGASIFTRGLGMALGLAAYRFFRKEWLTEYRSQIKAATFIALPVYLLLLLAMNGFFAVPPGELLDRDGQAPRVRFLPFYYHYFSSETQAMYSLLIHAGSLCAIGLMVWFSVTGGWPNVAVDLGGDRGAHRVCRKP